MKKFLIIFSILLNFIPNILYSANDLYEKIDIFGEVLENIKKEYVDDVDQAEMMDSAESIISAWSTSSTYSFFIFSKTSPKISIFSYRSFAEYRIFGMKFKRIENIIKNFFIS